MPLLRVNAVAPGWVAGACVQHTLAETIISVLITSNGMATSETIVIDGGGAATT